MPKTRKRSLKSEEGTKNNHESVEDQVEKLQGKVQTENKTTINIDDRYNFYESNFSGHFKKS